MRLRAQTEKAKFCESIGARKGINYRTSDFVAVVRDDSQGRGVDVILDMIGGDYTPRNIEALAEDGRLAIINFKEVMRPTSNFPKS